MKALMKSGGSPPSLILADIDEPVCRANEIKIEVKACGVCGTDLHIAEDLYRWPPSVPLGHEYSGVVVEVGSQVDGFRIGDRVTGCGRGGFARFVATDMRKGHFHFRLPDDVSFEEGALFEPLAACTHAVLDRSGITANSVVLVTGPGTIGLGALQLAKSLGCVVIVAGTSADGSRLETAARLGADHLATEGELDNLVWEVTKGRGVHAVLECSGASAALDAAIRLITYRGRITQLGLFGRPVQVDIDGLTHRGAELVTTIGFVRESWEQAIDLVRQGRIRLRDMISHTIPLTEWERGFETCRRRNGLKVLLTPD
jgi:L-iditol 2-dehydrogenase